jgi:GT2 family glycosyltransferase
LGRDERDVGQYAAIAERSFVDDVYVLVRRQVYDEVGGYAPDLFLQSEELDWQWRAKQFGWRAYFTPHARLWHHGSLSMGGVGSPTSEYFFVRNLIVVMARHSRLTRFLRFYARLAWVVLTNLARSLARRPLTLPARVAAVTGLVDGTTCLIWPRKATGIPAFIRWLNSLHQPPAHPDTAVPRLSGYRPGAGAARTIAEIRTSWLDG